MYLPASPPRTPPITPTQDAIFSFSSGWPLKIIIVMVKIKLSLYFSAVCYTMMQKKKKMCHRNIPKTFCGYVTYCFHEVYF